MAPGESLESADVALVDELNRRAGTDLQAVGRASTGCLGGAILARWPDGRGAVVTRFDGTCTQGERTARLVNAARTRGAPVPRHEVVVELGDHVYFVQERLPAGRSQPLSPDRVDAIVAANDRLAGVLRGLDGELPPMCLPARPDSTTIRAATARFPDGSRIIDRLTTLAETTPAEMDTGQDLVHTDLSAANVLLDDHGQATGIVDWNLGAYRGDRCFALITMRFDREWFLRRPDATPLERASADRLDKIIADRISPATQRIYWAQWTLHQLEWLIQRRAYADLDWQLRFAADRQVGAGQRV